MPIIIGYSRSPVSFVTDIVDIRVCPGYWINKKNGKNAFSWSAVSKH